MANANEYRLAQLLAEKQSFELGKFEQGELRECIEEDWDAIEENADAMVPVIEDRYSSLTHCISYLTLFDMARDWLVGNLDPEDYNPNA